MWAEARKVNKTMPENQPTSFVLLLMKFKVTAILMIMVVKWALEDKMK
jgi:hypothetical protein